MKPAGRIDPPAWMSDAPSLRLFAALAAAGIAARFVGGCVRNALLGRAIDDLDLAVDRPPETVVRALEAAKIKAVPTGLRRTHRRNRDTGLARRARMGSCFSHRSRSSARASEEE